MIAILVVDDNHAKTLKITNAIKDTFLGSECLIETAINVYAASQLLLRRTFDLMILDLNIPMRDEESSRADGGLCLLHSLKSNRNLHPPTHIIGLTAFDELYLAHRESLEKEGWVLLAYEDTSNAWEISLRHKLSHITETKRGGSSEVVSRPSPWITGSFYLCAFVVVMTVLAVIASAVPVHALLLVIVASLLIVPGIGFLQLRHDEKLRDATFAQLCRAYFSRLGLFRALLTHGHASRSTEQVSDTEV